MPEVTNKQDAGTLASFVDDEVDALRFHGSDRRLPLDGSKSLTLGAADDCDIKLDDPLGFVSKYHARLVRDGRAWTVRDLGSTNGVRIDDELRVATRLAAGMEVKLGSVKLVADSAEVRGLVAYLSRILGWAEERQPDVDRALRAVRDFAARRAVLALCGPGHLDGIASHLHALAVGRDAPVAQFNEGEAVDLARARGGTCVGADLHVHRLAELASQIVGDGDRNAHIVLCFRERQDAASWTAALARAAAAAGAAPSRVPAVQVVEVPSVRAREGDLERLMSEYAVEAVAALGAVGTGFREHDLSRIDREELATVDAIAKTMLRLVAVRNFGARGASERLGLSNGALARWIRRRNLPM